MTDEKSTRRRFLRLGGIALTTGLAGCSTASSEEGSGGSSTPTPAGNQTTPQPDRSTPQSVDPKDSDATSPYTQVYQEAIPSVVLVTTGRSQGTGFVITEGFVVTNAHVVGGASEAQVQFSDGTWAVGTVRGRDRHSDLAVVAVENAPDPAVPLSLVETEPTIGQEVVAIGNPFNLDGTVTSGIVSGLDRLVPAPSGYLIPDAIQTDAAVNPGNSGGPLMGLGGNVVGVVNAKRGDNIAFGISAALTQRVVPELIDNGEYEHAYMGVSVENVTPTVARANSLDEPRGLIVTRTVRGGPVAGVLQGSEEEFVGGQQVPVGGDVILAVDGTKMASFEDLASYLALQTRPGDSIELTILRDRTQQRVDVTLAARPTESRSPLR